MNLLATEQRGIDPAYRSGRLKTAFGGLKFMNYKEWNYDKEFTRIN
jgi:hypothetical protein